MLRMAICKVVTKVRSFLFATAAVTLAVAIPARAHAQDATSGTPPPVVAATPTPAAPSGPRMNGEALSHEADARKGAG